MNKDEQQSMGFFAKVGEFFRDKSRDNLCAGLQGMGINARMAARGAIEEKVGGKDSLGIIHIPEGPIHWVNVCKETHGYGHGESTHYYTEYGVPDPRLGPDSPGARIKTVRVKTFPLFGKVVDLRWKGWDSDLGIIGRLNSAHQLKQPILGIIGRLNSAHQLKQPIMDSRDVTITAIPGYSCWIMSSETHDSPSKELWSCYQSIAQHLLTKWSPNHGVK